MKSSRPLFTKKNPVQTTSKVAKAHYHPSPKKSLSKKEKKTTLSPVRLNQHSHPQLLTVSQETQQLKEKQHNRFTSADGQPRFTESWPSTDSTTNKQTSRAGKSTASPELEVQEASLLSKYIERFRHAPPQSREERQKIDSTTGETHRPFWWVLPSSCSSTPTKSKDTDTFQSLKDGHEPAVFTSDADHRSDRSFSPDRESFNILSDTSQGEFDDTEILQLQEKANRLLLRDECDQSDGSVRVSSEGLRCSDFSSQVSVDEELRRPLTPTMLKFTAVKAGSDSVQAASFQKPFVVPTLVTPARPEEDILFQWRLRRKIEQARELPQPPQHSSFHRPTFSWQAPIFSPPTIDGQFYKQQQSTQPPEFPQKASHPHVAHPHPQAKEAHLSCPPSSGVPPFSEFPVPCSSVSQTQAVGHVPAHVHLLCDVLPCPIQSSHGGRRQNISQNIDDSHVKVAHKKTQVPAHSGNISSDEPCCEHLPSPHPASSGTLGRVEPSDYESPVRNKPEKVQKTMSFRKQKREKVVSGSIQKGARKEVLQAEQHQPKGTQEKSDRRSDGPPPSPIHSALRQVVSEVFVAAVDSSPARRASTSSASRFTGSAPLPPSSAACDVQNSMEVVSQLLQEADDSDEKEFEDDPLLQVLRKQRSWVKEQIREVDSLLNDLLDKQPVTQIEA